MSLIIKSNQVNVILYKYLLQSGLSHTAYTMFNEAKLEQSLKQFKFDIKSGHLLNLLQKALIFTQIQAHINFSQYMECKQSFYLLKSHTCQITQKIKQDKQKLLKQLNQQLIQSMKRTNAIYNTELTNNLYDDIIYESRGANYFQKFQKFKFGDRDQSQKYKQVLVSGYQKQNFALYSKYQSAIYLLQNQLSGDLNILRIQPCVSQGNLSQVRVFKLIPNYLAVAFSDNLVKFLALNQSQFPSFNCKIDFNQQIRQIQFNENLPFLITISSNSSFVVLNIKNSKFILKEKGKIKFRRFDQFVSLQNNQLKLRSLLDQQKVMQFNTQNIFVQDFSFSMSKTFLAVSSYSNSKINIYTFQKQEPLYIFNFQEEQQILKQTLWISRKQVDYLVILTDYAVRVWEIQFNAYCLKIQIKKYDSNIQKVCYLQKDDEETYLVCLGKENIIVSDVANQKVERIQSSGLIKDIQNIGSRKVSMIGQTGVYFVVAQNIEHLFK